MMSRLRILFIIIISVTILTPVAWALEWKELHERADTMSSAEAYSMAREDRDSIQSLYVLALTYLNEHKNNQALAIFDRMLTQDQALIEAKWGKAEALRRKGDLELCERLLEAVIETDKKFYPAYITLSYLRYVQLEFSESVHLAYKVKNKGRENVDLSNYVRALLLIGGGKGMLAHHGGMLSKITNGTAILPNLKKAERLKPDSAEVLFGLGSFYFMAPAIIGGDLEKAQGYLERAIEEDPLFADPYVRLAQVYRARGDEAKYKEYLEKSLAIDPVNILALDAQSGECKYICISLTE